MTNTTSPYKKISPDKWPEVTAKLITAHPLAMHELVVAVLRAWTELHATKIGNRNLQIGKNIFPNPQILGFFLHELIPVELATLYPNDWRREAHKGEKDLVYIPDPSLSIEIKTSSHPSQIFGNRSYAQQSDTGKPSSKLGYFLTVNFRATKENGEQGKITRIRFGWLDHSDWIGQKSQTGQQACLSKDADKHKLVQIYPDASAKSNNG